MDKYKRKTLILALGAAGASLMHFKLAPQDRPEKDEDMFIMQDEARDYWLKGGIGLCGAAMRPNIDTIKEEALNGNLIAAFRLGQVYGGGTWGVKQDHAESYKWYRLAAEGGNHSAQALIGLAFEHGRGVNEDLNEAIKWYGMAVLSGKYPDLEKKIEELKARSEDP